MKFKEYVIEKKITPNNSVVMYMEKGNTEKELFDLMKRNNLKRGIDFDYDDSNNEVIVTYAVYEKFAKDLFKIGIDRA